MLTHWVPLLAKHWPSTSAGPSSFGPQVGSFWLMWLFPVTAEETAREARPFAPARKQGFRPEPDLKLETSGPGFTFQFCHLPAMCP